MFPYKSGRSFLDEATIYFKTWMGTGWRRILSHSILEGHEIFAFFFLSSWWKNRAKVFHVFISIISNTSCYHFEFPFFFVNENFFASDLMNCTHILKELTSWKSLLNYLQLLIRNTTGLYLKWKGWECQLSKY